MERKCNCFAKIYDVMPLRELAGLIYSYLGPLPYWLLLKELQHKRWFYCVNTRNDRYEDDNGCDLPVSMTLTFSLCNNNYFRLHLTIYYKGNNINFIEYISQSMDPEIFLPEYVRKVFPKMRYSKTAMFTKICKKMRRKYVKLLVSGGYQ